MPEKLKQYIVPFLVGVALICCCIVFYQIGGARYYQKGYNDALALPHKADTVWRDTTIYKDKPVPVTEWRDREKLVYVPYRVDSLIYIHDTTYVAVPREFKQYGDERYEAQVSGVDPSLDWIKIHQQTAYITNTVVQKKRWSWSITAGPGVFVDLNGAVRAGGGVVIGGSLNF